MAHKGARNDLTAEYVRSIFDYDPETGVLTWKKCHPHHAQRLGTPAGSQRRPDGRVLVSFKGQEYRAHRIIWLLVTGKWPPEEIDHIDHDPSNNRWANLRVASSSQNEINRGVPRNNTSGFKGVFFHAKQRRYSAYIKFHGKREHIGMFDTAEEAHAARRAREKELFGEFATTYNHVKALHLP